MQLDGAGALFAAARVTDAAGASAAAARARVADALADLGAVEAVVEVAVEATAGG